MFADKVEAGNTTSAFLCTRPEHDLILASFSCPFSRPNPLSGGMANEFVTSQRFRATPRRETNE
jgi:hypothetical protein